MDAPSRVDLAKFIADPRTLRAFEELFASVGSSSDGLVAGDIVWSGATTRAGALPANGASYLRTDYPDLFAAIGTAFGAVDATHFNVPDITGRVVAGKEAGSGTRLTVAGCGINGGTLGASGGAQTHTLTEAQMPTHKHSVSTTAGATGITAAHSHTHDLGSHTHNPGSHTHDISHTHSYTAPNTTQKGAGATYDFYTTSTSGTTGAASPSTSGTPSASATDGPSTNTSGAASSSTVTVTDPNHSHAVSESDKGSSTAHTNTQPTIVLNAFIIY